MSLPHTSLRLFAGFAVAVASSVGASLITSVDSAVAQEESLQSLRAPFTCGTEWAGATRSGHGLNDWNLDINRTSRTYSDPQHDLGQPLLAQADGTIVWIGEHRSAGTYVEIDYGDITARYIHVIHGSVPDGLEIGSTVVEGQSFGLLGDSGNATHAHQHLEYFDSRSYDDARAWLLPDANQIQIAMDGNPIDPEEAFTSTNCNGDSPPTTTTTAPPHPFTDVEADSFAYDDIALLYELAITQGTGASNYSPHTSVDREQMAAFLARIWRRLAPETPLPEGDYPFDDVDPSSFAYDDIHLIFDLGITTGTGPTTYSPADEVSREQMAAFLNRLHELLDPPLAASPPKSDPNPDPNPDPQVPDYPFADVSTASFAYGDIARIHQLGITTGTSESTYSPGTTVDREQMAAFLARVYRLLAPAD
jgi:hypothetical protein